MTLAIERPTAAARTVTVPITYPCPDGVPWCNDELGGGDPDHSTHWSGELYLPATGSRNAAGRLSGATLVSVLLAQTRDDEPTIALNVAYAPGRKGESDDAEMTLDEAEAFGRYLVETVAMLRGGGVR